MYLVLPLLSPFLCLLLPSPSRSLGPSPLHSIAWQVCGAVALMTHTFPSCHVKHIQTCVTLRSQPAARTAPGAARHVPEPCFHTQAWHSLPIATRTRHAGPGPSCRPPGPSCTPPFALPGLAAPLIRLGSLTSACCWSSLDRFSSSLAFFPLPLPLAPMLPVLDALLFVHVTRLDRFLPQEDDAVVEVELASPK